MLAVVLEDGLGGAALCLEELLEGGEVLERVLGKGLDELLVVVEAGLQGVEVGVGGGERAAAAQRVRELHADAVALLDHGVERELGEAVGERGGVAVRAAVLHFVEEC